MKATKGGGSNEDQKWEGWNHGAVQGGGGDKELQIQVLYYERPFTGQEMMRD